MLWIETRTPEDAEQLQKAMWSPEPLETADGVTYGVTGEGLREGEEFWADATAKAKDPHLKLLVAKRHLPMPAAFRDAAVALRAIIREQRKQKIDHSQTLAELYVLAAIWSFYIPYAPRVGLPGFEVMARVPFSEFEAMPLTWQTLGYEKLELLTKTDVRHLREMWGEVNTHTTAHELYRTVWDRYEDALVREHSD